MHSVLLISKNRSLSQMLEILLAQHAFIVRTERTFNEAFEELKRRGHYDLVLSLEDRSRQGAADLQRMIAKISPYSKFAKLSGISDREEGERGARLGKDVSMDNADVMDIIEEILRMSMEMKSKPGGPSQDDLKVSLYNTVYLLSSVLNFQNITNGSRFQEVMSCSVEMGKRLGFPQPLLDEIAFSALLKDIGMIKVDPNIKEQPRRLTSEEFQRLQKHCVHGVNIIMKIKLPWDLKDNILCHHERYDGSGYPLGLHRHDIPVGARIISAVDAYFSMTSARPYRKAMSGEAALDEIAQHMGSQFDPEISKVLMEVVNPGSEKKLAPSSGPLRVAVIDDQEETRLEVVKQVTKLGYQCLGLTGGHDALEYLRCNKVDIILCDLDMPGVDGFQLLHWIKQLPDLESIPFVLMSALRRESCDLVMGLEMGADDYLIKPFDDDQLQSRIEAVLSRKASNCKIIPDSNEDDGSMRTVKMLLKLKEEKATGELRVTSSSGVGEGSIHFIRGQMRHSTYAGRSGEAAFYALLAQNIGETEFTEGKIPREITITKSLEFMLIEGLRRLDQESPVSDAGEFELRLA